MGEMFPGRYELVDPLGSGDTGDVWRVLDHREQRYVAAKVMRQADAASLLRFVCEQAVRMHHPHVLTPLGWAGGGRAGAPDHAGCPGRLSGHPRR